MKKLSLALMYLCLLAAFCCGISELLFVDKAPRPSEEENRMLSGFPALSAQSLLSGDFSPYRTIRPTPVRSTRRCWATSPPPRPGRRRRRARP